MIRLLIPAVLAALVSATPVRAQIPYTFSPGQPARANEVNENFESLDARLLATEATITDISSYASPGTGLALVDANQQDIGQLVSMQTPIANGFNDGVALAYFDVGGSVEPFYFHLYAQSTAPYLIAETENVFFTGSNCTGTAYVRRPEGFFPIGLPFSVVSSPRELYVSTANADATVPSIASRLQHDTGQCLVQGGLPSDWQYFPVTNIINLSLAYPEPWSVESK